MIQTPYIREGFGFNTYDNLTTLHPLGLAALVVGVVWTLGAPRRRAWLPMLLMACFVSTSQRIVIATLDFNFIRALLVAAGVRILIRREYADLRLTRLDKLVFAWALTSAVVSVLRIGTLPAFIQRSGNTYDTIGLYLVGRIWLRTGRDVQAFSKAVAVIASVAVLGFLREHLTGRNVFSIFGGVSEYTTIRDGRLRCQGPFSHPILAGTFWVGLLPLTATLLRRTKERYLGSIGVLSIVGITIFSSSSTPLLGLIASAAFGALWLTRRHTSALRWGAVATLVGLHLIMNGPVWSLIARVGVVGGSTGYHRYQLIDAFINRWTEWFILGTNSTAHWGWFLFDIANQFVREGVVGGAASLGLFAMVLASAFSSAGRPSVRGTSRTEIATMWAVGTAIAAHCVMFIGISISHSNTNMLVFLWLLAATQSQWKRTHRSASNQNLTNAAPSAESRVAIE